MHDPHFDEIMDRLTYDAAKLLSETWGCPESFRIVGVTRLPCEQKPPLTTDHTVSGAEESEAQS